MKYLLRLLRGLALVMVIGVVNLTDTALPLRAAPANQTTIEITFKGRSEGDIPKVCLGKTYEIQVNVYYEPTNRSAFRNSRMRDVKVTSTNARRGLIRPINPFTEDPDVPSMGRVFPATFEYIANREGDETIQFSAEKSFGSTRSDTEGGPGRTQHLGDKTLNFKVEPCEPKVELVYHSAWHLGGGATVHWSGIMEEVTLKAHQEVQPVIYDAQTHGIDFQNQIALSGEGMMTYSQYWTGRPGACSATYSTLEMPATVSGEMGEDRLNLQFDFQGGQVVSSSECILPGFGSFASSETNESDPSPIFNQPLSFPMEGGVVTYTSPFNPPPGTVFVIVTLEEDEEEATSDSGGDLLAALDAWSQGWFVGWPGTLE
jgi:hypothetical protein